ncbi:hypothetical protein AABM38_20635 [Heyndrickxia sp. MSNUG]|uniref:hypothetical protein n=1 Tax=Heyndrickxia sp. MSNUG TaxID=3136677 RepID=UPI003C2E3B3F
MSVKQTHYVMLGIDIGFYDSEKLYEGLEPYMEEGGEIFCLYDGMNGEYIILGEILHKGDDYHGMDLKKHTIGHLEAVSKDVYRIAKRVMAEIFQKESDEIKMVKPSLIMVTHHE